MMDFLLRRRIEIKRIWRFDRLSTKCIKNFKFADPVKHENLFKLAENYVKNHVNEINHSKYSFLLKL